MSKTGASLKISVIKLKKNVRKCKNRKKINNRNINKFNNFHTAITNSLMYHSSMKKVKKINNSNNNCLKNKLIQQKIKLINVLKL